MSKQQAGKDQGHHKMGRHGSDISQSSYEMAVTSWSNTGGAANPQGFQIAAEEIKMEQEHKKVPNAARAFDWSFVPK